VLTGCYWIKEKDGGYIQILTGSGEENHAGLPDFETAKFLLSVSEKPLQNVAMSDSEGVGGAPSEDQMKNICTQQHAVDYDGDGDLDLVVGCFESNFFLYENIGENGKNELVESPVELSLKLPGKHAAPHLVDFDRDGDLDFLSGSMDGGVYIAINNGTRENPDYGEFQSLVAKPEKSVGPPQPESIQPGTSTRVWSTDYNGDGLMDLLVGDSVTLIEPAHGVSEEEFEKRHSTFLKKLARFRLRTDQLRESKREVSAEFQKVVGAEFRKLLDVAKEFQVEERTGYVWVLLQEPASSTDVTSNAR
jgi:hypothetical protein